MAGSKQQPSRSSVFKHSVQRRTASSRLCSSKSRSRSTVRRRASASARPDTRRKSTGNASCARSRSSHPCLSRASCGKSRARSVARSKSVSHRGSVRSGSKLRLATCKRRISKLTKPKSKKSAYVLFVKEQRKISKHESLKALAERWKKMSPTEKNRYVAEAKSGSKKSTGKADGKKHCKPADGSSTQQEGTSAMPPVGTNFEP